MRNRIVIFDIDGTLVDSNEQHVAAWEAAFAEEGSPRTAAAIREQIGKGGDLLVPALIPHADEGLIERASERHGRIFAALYLKQVRPFAGAVDLVRRVHASGREAVLASSAKRDEVDHYVDLLGLADVIAATTSIDDVATSKPAPDIFREALRKVDASGGQAIVIGDTPYDVEAAHRAGIAAIGLTSGPFEAQRLRDAGAVAVFADVADLLGRFDESAICRG